MKKITTSFLVRLSRWERKSTEPLMIPGYIAFCVGFGPALVLVFNLLTMGSLGASAPIPLLGHVRWALRLLFGTKIGIVEAALFWSLFGSISILFVLSDGVLLPLLKLARRKERELPEYWQQEADRLSKRPELAALLSPLRDDPLGMLREKVTAITESDYEKIARRMDGLQAHKEKLGLEIAESEKSLAEEDAKFADSKRKINL